MLTPDQALDEAIAEGMELAKDEAWETAFSGARPRLPVLVRNLTKPASDYYLVDFRKADRSTGRMVLNPSTGNADLVSGIEYDGETLPEFIGPGEVLARIPPLVYLDDGRQVRVPVGTPQVELVWAHCHQSQTMFEPFYRLLWTDGSLYLRIDGKFFDRLTSTGLDAGDIDIV